MKLSERMALIKAGYTKDEIKAFEEEKDDITPAAGGADAGIIKAIGLMADQLNQLQANFTKSSGALSEPENEDINTILAKLQGEPKKEDE